MDPPPLPAPWMFRPEELLCCPWCRSYDIDAATIRLDALWQAHAWGEMEAPALDAAGEAATDALTIQCPDCQRPSMVGLALVGRRPWLRLTPVRTAADVAFLSRR